MSKELEAFRDILGILAAVSGCEVDMNSERVKLVNQALQRLDKYEQILGSGRLTHWNYKNTTLPLESCKPYLRLGQLEDIYEEEHKNE